MWTMGCNKGSETINRSDSVKTRRLRPLMPRPTTAIPTNNTYSAVATPYCSCLLKANLFTLNDHLGADIAAATMKEQSKADTNTEIPLVSSRWNPTPDQLHALEELYRGGTRTPTADQIQQIAAKLRRFGKIEEKNVFYWFQNHKARERQKRSHNLDSLSEEEEEEEEEEDIESLERKEPGTGFEVAQAKYGATSSNCSTLSEESVCIHRAVGSESRTDGWIQSEERELMQQRRRRRRRRSKQTKHATWQLLKPSSPPPTIHFMNTITAPEEALGTVDPNLSSTRNLKMQPQTLQLFPIDDDQSVSNVNHGSSFTPDQFFEFLPLKN